jgi:gliding motility-associated-like protein
MIKERSILKSIFLSGFLFIVFIPIVFSQKQYNVWAFGMHSGIDFNTTPPKGIKNLAIEINNTDSTYASSICDSAGRLLLYTDGTTVWNKYGISYERFMGRWPWSLYCVPLIVPHPENDSLFYIFGVSKGSYANRLQYLTVNALSNFGYGEIIYPQPSTLDNYYTILKDNASVVIAGTAHCNKRDNWIVTYSAGAFYAYLVTIAGVAATPVVSTVPQNIISNSIVGGNIKFSASGEKLVVPLRAENATAVLDFDSQTGLFSKPIRLPVPDNTLLEDVELSPDGTKLYEGVYSIQVFDEGSATTELHAIYQMNLDAGSLEAIKSSLYPVTIVPDRVSCGGGHLCFGMKRTLQLGPDGKIYASMRYTISPDNIKLDQTVSVIENPNEAGINARYIRNGLSVGNMYYYVSYNYIRSTTYTVKKNGIQHQKNVCADKPVQFSLLLNHIDSVRWNFGDDAGSGNSSTSLRPQHQYSKPDAYRVTALIYSKCITDTAYADIVIEEDKSVHIPDYIKDSIVCKGTVLQMNAATIGALSYLWNGGNTKPVQEITVSGTYAVTVTNSCSVDQKLFTVDFKECNCNVYVPTAFTPNGDGINDYFRPVVKCFPGNFKFSVYNRLGSIVYQTSDIQAKGWDGKIRSEDANTATYIWTLMYKDPNTHSIQTKNGTVTLLR